MAMFDASFAQLFRAVERVRLQLESSDRGLQPYLAEELLSLQELGEQIIDQWMTLDEHIRDLMETYQLHAQPFANSQTTAGAAVLGPGMPTADIESRTNWFEQRTGLPAPPVELELTQWLETSESSVPALPSTTGNDGHAAVGLVEAVFSWSDEAVADFRKGLAFFDLLMWDQAGDALQRVLNETDAPFVRLYLSAILAAQGRVAQSRAHLRQVRSQVQDRIVTAAALEVEAHNSLAQGHFTEATHCFESIVKLVPESSDAWYNLGLSRLMAGCLDEAEQALRTVVSADGEDSDAWSLLTQTLYRKGNPVAALEACQRGLSFRPMNTGLLLWKSKLLQSGGELLTSARIAENLADLHPDHPEVITWESWLLLSNEQPTAAISRLKRFLSVKPNHPLALLQLGVAYLLDDSLDRAERVLTGAIPFSPGRSLLWLALGAVQSARHNGPAAQKLSLRAIRDPRKSIRRLALYQYARALQHEAKHHEAQTYLRAAHVLGKPSVAILQALAECAIHLGRPLEAAQRRQQAQALAKRTN